MERKKKPLLSVFFEKPGVPTRKFTASKTSPSNCGFVVSATLLCHLQHCSYLFLMRVVADVMVVSTLKDTNELYGHYIDVNLLHEINQNRKRTVLIWTV